MTEQSQFYVNLVSTSCKNYYAQNNASLFRIQLPSPISLDGNWEVALTEITYPNNWNNLLVTFDATFLFENFAADTVKWGSGGKELDRKILKAISEIDESEEQIEYHLLRVSIPEGYFDSVEDLGRYVSYNIRKNAKENFNLTRHILTFEYDEPANIFSFKLHPGGVFYFDNSRMTYPS